MGGRFQEDLVGWTRVFQNPESIPALQVPYFASCVVDCLHNGEQKKVFDWKVPEGVFQEGFVQDQAWNLSLTCDYNNVLMSLRTTLRKISDGILLSMEQLIKELRDRSKSYLQTYFCNQNYHWSVKDMVNGQELWCHYVEPQKYLLDSQLYRAFYDFDEEFWNLIREIIADLEVMRANWNSVEEILSFSQENIWKIVWKYSGFLLDNSTSWPRDKKLEISYTPIWKPRKTLVLLVRDISYEDYKYHRNGG